MGLFSDHKYAEIDGNIISLHAQSTLSGVIYELRINGQLADSKPANMLMIVGFTYRYATLPNIAIAARFIQTPISTHISLEVNGEEVKLLKGSKHQIMSLAMQVTSVQDTPIITGISHSNNEQGNRTSSEHSQRQVGNFNSGLGKQLGKRTGDTIYNLLGPIFIFIVVIIVIAIASQ